MRTTQFIGLTAAGEAFVKDLRQLPSDTVTSGMFEEEIPLRRWEIHPLLANEDRRGQCIREIVQMEPWSSGPMIFTCLEIDWGWHEDSQLEESGEGNKTDCFQWIQDPTLSREFCQQRADEEWGLNEDGSRSVTITCGDEYDQEKGTMWV
jgi:hypothetical protein